MSRAIALVKFKDGTILRGCYDGTGDWLRPWLITEQELKQKYNGSIFEWDDIMYENSGNLNTQNNIKDVEEVEIFSDYGRGSSWRGKASKKEMVVVEGRYKYDAVWLDDIPNWVIEYFSAKGWDYKRLLQ